MMTEDEVARLAALGAALRPDWASSSLRTFIARHLTARSYGDTAVALAWVAAKTKTDTPRLLLEAGVWWRAALSDSETGGAPRTPFNPTTSCDECSQPEHRHTSTSGHDFISVHDAMRRRDETPKPPLPRQTNFRELLPSTDTQETR